MLYLLILSLTAVSLIAVQCTVIDNPEVFELFYLLSSFLLAVIWRISGTLVRIIVSDFASFI